jgi:hypothetical protein
MEPDVTKEGRSGSSAPLRVAHIVAWDAVPNHKRPQAETLEQKLNRWLEDHPNVPIEDLRYSSHGVVSGSGDILECWSVLIFYRENRDYASELLDKIDEWSRKVYEVFSLMDPEQQ